MICFNLNNNDKEIKVEMVYTCKGTSIQDYRGGGKAKFPEANEVEEGQSRGVGLQYGQ